MDVKAPSKILVIKPSSLGDIVHSLPFLHSIRKCYPKAEVHWVVARGLHGILEGHPMIDRLWIIHKDDWKRPQKLFSTVRDIIALSKGLKAEGFDAAVDLQGLLRSGLISLASGASVKLGFSEAREGGGFFYTHRIDGGKDVHAVDRYLKLAARLGCDISDIRFPLPVSSANPIEGRYAVLVPGARWNSKRWPTARFGELAAMLSIKSVIVGSVADEGLARAIVEGSKGKSVSLAGRTTLRELAAIMKGAEFVVSNDSGPMHIAAAFGVPVFAVFGPTSSVRTGPYGDGHTVIKSDLSCAPCFKRHCDDLRCMEGIPAEKVLEAIKGSVA